MKKMSKNTFFAFIILLLATFHSIESIEKLKNYNERSFEKSRLKIKDESIELNVTANSTRFFMIGDWGGIPVFPYRTVVEQDIAFYMSVQAQSSDTHFTLAVGDNFYFNGIANVSDKRFDQSFETVFTQLDMPFFQILGKTIISNHDHIGNASAQIDYSKYSKRWIMPDYNFSINVNINEGRDKLISFICVDTVLMCGHSGYDWMSSDKYPLRFRSRKEKLRAKDQFKWVEEKLKQATRENYPYIIVAGHYPVWSISEHGPTKCLVENLRPLLHTYNVTAYFAGHEHDMQHLQDTYLNTTVDYIISGAADFPFYSNSHINDVPQNSSKFYWANNDQLIGAVCLIDTNPDNMTITYVTTNRKTIYQIALNSRIRNKNY